MTVQLLEELAIIRIVMTNDFHPAEAGPFSSGRVLTAENPCSRGDEDIAATAKYCRRVVYNGRQVLPNYLLLRVEPFR
jgi:hypothetical protein